MPALHTNKHLIDRVDATATAVVCSRVDVEQRPVPKILTPECLAPRHRTAQTKAGRHFPRSLYHMRMRVPGSVVFLVVFFLRKQH